jgi:capsular exopolysaccharide synthesis family protein
VTAESPARAAEIANAWVDAYIREQVTAKVNSSLKSRDVLEARLDQARDAVTGSEGAFDRYINDSLSQIVTETGRADIATMRDELASLGATQNANAQRAELAQASLEQRNWTALADTLQSEALRELDRQQRELSTRITVASAQASVDLKSELARIEQRLVDAAAGGLSSLRQSVAAAETQQGEVRQQLRAAVLGSSLSPEILSRIYELQQGSEVARSQYQTLLGRIKDAEAQAAVQIADSRVVSAALPPARPSFPDIGLSIALATLGGLGLGLGLAFLRENLVGGILTEEQAAAVLKVPVAAALPRERPSGNGGPGGLADVMVTSALSSFPEGVRRIKVLLDQANHRRALKRGRAGQPAGGRVIMVTSSTANEGKSTIALSLARAFALSRRSVVIIDCDLRKPTLHRMLGLPTSATLIDYLSGPGDAPDRGELVAKDPATELRVIVGSRPSDVPTDQLIAGPAFTSLLEAAKAAYDVVILDTPPVGPVVDGLYLAQMADFVLFVLRAGTTSQTEARMALQAIREARAANSEIFAVLNQQDRASASYKGKYESYYFSETE